MPVEPKKIITRLLSQDDTLTYSELAEYAGVSRGTVYRIVHKHKLPKANSWDVTSRHCLGGCGKRLTYKSNKGGWCKPCLTSSYSYVFRCGWCKEVRVVKGVDASTRRSNDKRKKTHVNFCNNVCSGKYIAKMRENENE